MGSRDGSGLQNGQSIQAEFGMMIVFPLPGAAKSLRVALAEFCVRWVFPTAVGRRGPSFIRRDFHALLHAAACMQQGYTVLFIRRVMVVVHKLKSVE